MEYELRVYTVKPGRLETWVAEWSAQVYPLRRRHGFEIPGAWVDEADDRFVWLLAFDGPEGFDSADEAYYASPERASMKPDPARHLEHVEHRRLRSVLPTG